MSVSNSDQDYVFLTTLLRARQADMLSGDKLEQMISSESYAEAAKVLSECGWPDFSEADSAEIDRVLTERRCALFDEISAIIPQPEVMELVRLRYDYHNAKTLIKSEGAGVEGEYLLSEAGTLPGKKLEKEYTENEYILASGIIATAMREAKAVLARTENPQLADSVLDRAYYHEMSLTAKKLGNDFIQGYVRTLIDGANLRTLIRCARMRKDADFVATVLLPGGSFQEPFLARQAGAADGIAAVFAGSAYGKAAELGAKAVHSGSLTAFELECDNVVNRYIAQTKLMSFGPEMVLGYLTAEENNITAVRMILTGILAGIAPERLRERLRDTYV